MAKKEPKASELIGDGDEKKRRQAPSVDRSKYKFSVWVGKKARPAFWCNSKDEINAKLGELDAKKLVDVTVGSLQQIEVETTVKAKFE